MKKIVSLLVLVCMTALSATVLFAQTNLLTNGGFEESKESSFLGIVSTDFPGWDKVPSQVATAETDDKVEGNQCMRVTKAKNNHREFYQEISVLDMDEGTEVFLSGYCKMLESVGDADLELECYWIRLNGSGQASDTLRQVVGNLPLDQWLLLEGSVIRPANASRLHLGVKMAVGVSALFDDFKVYTSGEPVPSIKVSPTSFSEVEAEINTEVSVGTLTLTQANMTSATTLEVTGNDAQMFRLSQTEVSQDVASAQIEVFYRPTAAGHHEAAILFDNKNHTTALPSIIVLRGVCKDSSTESVFTVSPMPELPDFECVEGSEQSVTIMVSSENVVDYPTASINHIKGAAFVIDRSMFPRNTDSDITVTFKPSQAGSFESQLTLSCSDTGDKIVFNLKGTATAKTAENIDWQLEPVFDMSNPLKMLNEPFDNAGHNKTLKVDGWQNVADLDARPWWGFDEDGSYAKATAYQLGKATTGEWTIRLITPALDYKNAANKLFTFKVKGDFISDEIDNPTKLELHLINAMVYGGGEVSDEVIDVDIPADHDAAGEWVSLTVDLSDRSSLEVFFMEFRYIGPNGAEGVVTYYVDDVTWGVMPTGVENIARELDLNAPMYNVLGTPVGKDYKGIVIQNGRKYIIK